jgi:glycosyltransferase involved in cell wall biosynthesis
MHVCLICSQIAAWGKIGGFGTATRALGIGLIRSGFDVTAVVPRRSRHGQGSRESLDGITVLGVSPFETMTSGRIFREVDADIYHSQEPTIATRWAQKTMPDRVHIVTCRDPRGWRDHILELSYANSRRRLLFPISALYEASPWTKESVRRADAVLTPAPSALDDRIRAIYGSSIRPRFVPYPVDIPATKPVKSSEPSVLFVGRFDPRKRLELFLELARTFPGVSFTAVGMAHNETYDRRLRRLAKGIANVRLTGFVSRFGKPNVTDYYATSWILANTSAREGLPYSFVEAAAYGNAILSGVDPENFASRFGYRVTGDDYAEGLRWLLQDERCKEKGQAAAEFVAGTWNEANCISRHLELYAELTGQSGPQSTGPTPSRTDGRGGSLMAPR